MSKNFSREDKQRLRVSDKWRKPRGLHNKVRLQKRGHIHLVKVGYKTKTEARNLINGKQAFVVNSLNDLKNAKNKLIIIGKNVGMKKRIALLNLIESQKLTIHNIKDVNKYIEKSQQSLKDRQEKRNQSIKKKETAKAGKKETKTLTEKTDELVKEDESKKDQEEKKKLDKLLTKPEK